MTNDKGIFDNSVLLRSSTTPDSNQPQDAATQSTGQPTDAATQNTGQQTDAATQSTGQQTDAATQTSDASQAEGGEDNAAVKTPDGESVSTDFNGGTQGSTIPPAGTATPPPAEMAGNSLTGQVRLPDGSLVNQSVQLNDSQIKQLEGAASDGVAVQTPSYLADWGNTPFLDAVKNGQSSIADYIGDYDKWATANGKDPLDIWQIYQAINGKDATKSYADNVKDDKRLQRQQQWEQIGNVLMHLGNFAGTAIGAPQAQYESGPELTKRQQAIKDATLKRRGDPKDLLAMIWKDRADQRAKELNDANVALQGARQKNIEGDTANDKAKADADVALKGSQKKVADTAADENVAQTNAINNKDKRDTELQPYKKEQLKSAANANNARATASKAQAAHSAAATRATNIGAYGKQYSTNRWRIWAKNRRLHPDESKQFMKDNNIHSWDRKNWDTNLIDQYNGYIADKMSSRHKKSGTASSLLD